MEHRRSVRAGPPRPSTAVAPVADDLRGRSRDDGPVGHVRRDDRAHPDDRVVAEAHPVGDARARAHPDVASHPDPARGERLIHERRRRIEPVIVGQERGAVRDAGALAHDEPDAPAVEGGARVHDDAVAEGDRPVHEHLRGDRAARADAHGAPGLGQDDRAGADDRALAEAHLGGARDNPEWRAGLPGLALLLLYYLVVWHRYGRDPAGATVIPRFSPPQDVSAADARFLERRGYDERTFAAAVVALAVKGHLRIREGDGRDYTLERPQEPAAEPLLDDEKILFGALGVAPGGALPLRSENAVKVGAAHKALKDALRKEHLKRHFVTNGKYLIPGLVGSFVALVAATLQSSRPDPLSLFMLFWLTGWTFGVAILVTRALDAWRQALAGKWLLVVPALFITAFSIPFIGGEMAGLYVLFTQGSPLMAALLLLLVGVNFLFYRLLQAPTLAGRRLLDELAGFRMYLDVAEKDELRVRRGPERTLQLFEKYLPYALALGVENAWAEQFSDILDRARATGGADAVPRWYSGSSWDSAGGGFAGALAGGLSSAIASASSSPGSSSGGGGGGSSGGGGGGGGGGGW